MDIQLWVVIIAFAAAVTYMGRKLYRQLRHKDTGGCGDCPAVPREIKKELRKEAP